MPGNFRSISAVLASALIAGAIMVALPANGNAQRPASNRGALAEYCVAFDPQSVGAVENSGGWKVTPVIAGTLDFGPDGAAAQRAIEVIQHYHFTRECFVRGPNPRMMYWKNGVAVPPGNMSGQDCIVLRPEAVAVAYVAGGWKVLDGDAWILDYGPDRAAADLAVHVIRTYSLNRECFIARPHVVMQYWLSE